MSEPNIACPKCGAEFPLTDAVMHRLRADLESEFDRRLAAEKASAEAQAARQAEERLALQIKDLEARVAEEEKKRRAAEQMELDLRKKQRELEEAKAAQELELARRLDEERIKIAEEATRRAAEAERLNTAQKEKVIADLQREIALLKQRAEQGSMQLQGETLEITLESDLRTAFPFDEVEEVKKGQRGADALQIVRTNQGSLCGTILWEAKRAKNWSNEWPAKLKEDQREARADLAVLTSTILPVGIRGIGFHDGVWVCDPTFAIPLATALRQGLIAAAAQRIQQTNRADKAQILYDHICSPEFRQHVEAVVEAFKGLKEQMDAEKRAFARQWKEREAQLERAILHTAMLYGGVQGIAGREALPEVQALALHDTPDPSP